MSCDDYAAMWFLIGCLVGGAIVLFPLLLHWRKH